MRSKTSVTILTVRRFGLGWAAVGLVGGSLAPSLNAVQPPWVFQEAPPEGEEPKEEPQADPNKPAELPKVKTVKPADGAPKKTDEPAESEGARRAEELRKSREAARKQRAPSGKAAGGDRPAATLPKPGHVQPDGSVLPTLEHGAGETGPAQEINIPPADAASNTVPPEERTYSFSIKDGTYEDLIESVARQTGLGVLGSAPEGKVTFVEPRMLTFVEMLSQVRMLLFNYKAHDPYWINYKRNFLEVKRVTDLYREMGLDRMFPSVEAFRESDISDEELGLLVFTPKSGSIADHKEVRQFLPDYVRVSPVEGQNSLIIFALVRDIKKYLDLAEFFGGRGADPRTLKVVKIEHAVPSELVTKLQTLMGFDRPKAAGGGAARPGRPQEQSPLDNIPEPPVDLLPDDALHRILVYAMQDKIREVERLLPILDVPPEEIIHEPVLIDVKHQDPAELCYTIQQILSATPDPNVMAAAAPKSTKKKKGQAPGAAAAPPVPVGPLKVEDITMIPDSVKSQIIVLADDEGVARVRHLVAMFDVPTEVGPLRIPVYHVLASDLVTSIMAILYGDPTLSGGAPFHLVSDRSEDFIWFTGSEKDLTQIKDLAVALDVPEPEAVMHFIELKYQKPSFVVTVLRALESTEPAPQVAPATPAPKKGGKKSKATLRIPDPSKFMAEDDTNRLYVLCTDDEWGHYLKIIEDLEAAGKPAGPVFERIKLTHITPENAIDRLSSLMPTNEETSHIRYAASEGSLLVINATPIMLDEMRAILAELDRPSDVIERTFEIRFADAAEIETLIISLLGEPNTAAPRPKPKRSSKSDEAPAVVVPASSESTGPLTVARLGNRILVRASPATMQRVEDLIREFDVDAEGAQLRTYGDFVPGTDIEGIASTLTSVFSGSIVVPKSGKKNRPETAEGPRFIAQPAQGKLIVLADPSLYVKIEDLLTVLRTGGPESGPILTRFVDLQYADPAELIESLGPILETKVRQWIVTGELVEPPSDAVSASSPKKGAKAVTRNDRYHLEPDVRNRRIVIAAPQKIVDEAVALIAEFDRPGLKEDEVVMRTVNLTNADAEEMVRTVRELMGAAPPRAGSGKKKATSAPETQTVALTITEAPGGKAVILRGMPEDVEQAAKWVDEINHQSLPGRTIKVYQIERADITKLADLIMAVADIPERSAAGRKAPSPPRKGKEDTEDLDELEDEDFTLVNTRVGSEVYVQTDLLAKTMIVAASQAKIAQIDSIVAQFDAAPEEGMQSVLEESKPIPKFIYELKHASAFGAVWDLEEVLESVWDPPNELPKVREASFGEALIIRYPYENRFEEIRELIEKYVDRPSKEDVEVKRKPLVPPTGINPKEAALWLKNRYPNLEIEIITSEEKQDEEFGVEQIKPVKQAAANPCVLPVSFALAASALVQETLAAAQQQPEPEEEDVPDFEPADPILNQAAWQLAQLQDQPEGKKGKDEPGAEGEKGSESKKSRPSASGPVKITVDQDRGVIIVEGASAALEDIEDGMDDFEEEIKDLPEKPDIRVYRVRYIDVYTAEDILNEMFNTPRAQQQQAGMNAALAARLAQMQAAQGAMRAGQMPNAAGGRQPEGAQPGQPQGAAAGRGAQMPMPPQLNMPQASSTSVRVFPNPRDRTLLLRAHTSQYPEILRLLATIDQPKPIDSELKVFPLTKLNAADVEEMLKNMLGLDQPTGGGRRANAGAAPGGGSSAASSAAATLPQRVEARPVTGQLPLTVDPKDIKITSNEDSNSILVMAPKEAVTYIGNLIGQLESQDIPERITKHYALAHADVVEVSEYLTNQFAEARSVVRGSRRRGRAPAADGAPAAVPATPTASGFGGGSINAPTFVAYARLNLLTAQATAEQMVEIDALVARLDVASEQEQWQTIPLAHAEAKAVADTLTAMFGQSGGGGPSGGRLKTTGATSGPKFIGEEGGRIVFFSAPTALEPQIQAAVAKLEEQSKDLGTARVIELVHAVPTEVADQIDAAYGGGRRGGAKGGKSGSVAASGTRYTVMPNDASKRLFVMADDDMFGRIESLAKTLDQPKHIGFDFRIYPLKFANARGVYNQMTKLVTDYLRMLGGKGGVEPFSVEVDDRANALIVLGGPVVFGFVEKALTTIDVASNANPTGFFMAVLKNADAQEVAGNITRLWAQKGTTGEAAPQVESNRATNALIVRGTQSQIEEIRKQVLEPLEQQAQPLKTETITLTHVPAEVASSSIKQIFDDKKLALQSAGKNVSPVELNVAVTPDVNTNQIIVQASEANLQQIKARVAELDKPEVAGLTATTTKTYTIKFADTNGVANMITQWARARVFTPPSGRVAPRDQVTALAEPVTQTVVVTANDTNHKLIEAMIREVDTDKAFVERSTVVYPARHADPNGLVGAITAAFRPDARGGRPRPEDQVNASVELATQSVIVTASTKNHEAIRALIEKADVAPGEALQAQPHVINLKNADAEALARMLNDSFVRTAARPGSQQAMTISALPGSRAILVKCKADDFERIRDVVAELDREDVAAGEEVRVVPILYGDATEMQTALQEYLKKPGMQSGRGTSLIGDVRVSVLAQGNAVVVSGEKDEVDRLEQTIHQLDTATEKGTIPQIISLKHANVAQIMPAVQEMFENPSGGARRGQAPPVIVADETLNSIVFRASSTDGQAIRAMVEQLDTQEQAAKKNYRIIKVAAGMNLTKLAEDVEDAVNESAEQVGGGGAGRGRQQPRVTITPNAQTRTLLVAGTPTLFDQVEEIVQAYEGMGPQAGETTTAIFSLKNVTPEEVDALIGQLTDQGSAAGRSPSRSSGGPRPPAQNRPRRPNP